MLQSKNPLAILINIQNGLFSDLLSDYVNLAPYRNAGGNNPDVSFSDKLAIMKVEKKAADRDDQTNHDQDVVRMSPFRMQYRP
jgi:hypothetical protein